MKVPVTNIIYFKNCFDSEDNSSKVVLVGEIIVQK